MFDIEIFWKTVIHTTSAGTQGIVNAVKADKIITGSLINAKAIAEYIKNLLTGDKNPQSNWRIG